MKSVYSAVRTGPINEAVPLRLLKVDETSPSSYVSQNSSIFGWFVFASQTKFFCFHISHIDSDSSSRNNLSISLF
jgi:hypothetical protein